MGQAYMEFIRGRIFMPEVEPAGVISKKSIALPSSKTETMAVLVHSIDIEMNRCLPQYKAGDIPYFVNFSVLLHEPNTDGDCGISMPGVLAYYAVGFDLVETALTVLKNVYEVGQRCWKFDPPVLVAQDFLWICGWKSADIDVGRETRFRLGYTIEKVSREAFIASLVR